MCCNITDAVGNNPYHDLQMLVGCPGTFGTIAVLHTGKYERLRPVQSPLEKRMVAPAAVTPHASLPRAFVSC